MSGSKRIRSDDDEQTEQRLAPKDYSFNFVPTIQPHERIFDLNVPSNISTRPIDLGVNTLTQRFISRSRRFWMVNRTPTARANNAVSIIKPSSYEPTYPRHQDISYTVIIYIQMAFNVIISTTILYIFSHILLTVRQDFRLKAQEHTDELHKQKFICTNNYIINHCGETDRIPAIESMCDEWASCMNRDIRVAQAKVSAEAIAEIINSFVEPISYKTLVLLYSRIWHLSYSKETITQLVLFSNAHCPKLVLHISSAMETDHISGLCNHIKDILVSCLAQLQTGLRTIDVTDKNYTWAQVHGKI